MFAKGQRVLKIIFFLTLAFCILEFVGGKLSHSLALLADASHMLTDLGGLGLVLFSTWMSSKKATRKMTYGFYRLEILSALVNGTLLLTIAVFIVLEAFHRLNAAQPIRTGLMLSIAIVGFILNVLSAWMLADSAKHNISMRGAFFHILSDTFSSLGTIVAGVLIRFTTWPYIDPMISFAIAILIVVSAWRLLKDVVAVLLEAVPEHINMEKLEERILSVEGILAIHDLHVWSITSGHEALSAHLEAPPGCDFNGLLACLNEILSKEFNIHHTTLQIESAHKHREENEFFRH